jgi:secreted trypsin-like serine protease
VLCGLVVSVRTVWGQDLVPIGDGTRYLCDQSGGQGRLFQVKDGSLIEVEFRRQIEKARTQKKKLSGKLRSAIRRNEQEKIDRFRALRDEWSRILSGIVACRDYSAACGIFEGTSASAVNRIINGSACSRESSPIVQLFVHDAEGIPVGGCSGIMLTAKGVLTAAHCFFSSDPGTRIESVNVANAAGQQTSRSFFVHPDYIYGSGQPGLNDIAVVLLDEGWSVKAMPLLTFNDLQSGEKSAIAGYGTTEHGDSDGLRAGFVTVDSASDQTVAIVYNGSESNTCWGDSGGPLAVSRGGTWYVAGITSDGDDPGCGVQSGADRSYFTNITASANMSFIAEHVPGAFHAGRQ